MGGGGKNRRIVTLFQNIFSQFKSTFHKMQDKDKHKIFIDEGKEKFRGFLIKFFLLERKIVTGKKDELWLEKSNPCNA